jgi:hypothetical protein
LKAFPFPNKTGSREELERDILYKKIPDADKDMICDTAWSTGVKAAEDIYRLFPDKSISEIIKESGLKTEKVNKDNVSGNIRFFSEYFSGPNKIVLYATSIRLWAKHNNMSENEAERLILSHEYFHFLECNKIGLVSRQYLVPTLRIGRLTLVKSGVRALSEIGAHGFSRRFYELKGEISPDSKDDVKLVNHAMNLVQLEGKKTADKIYKESILGKMMSN